MQLVKKALLALFVCTFALVGFVPSANALQPTATIQPKDPGDGRFCAGGNFNPWSNWGEMKSSMDSQFGPYNGNLVWQAPNEDAVWNVYCAVTDGKASITDTDAGSTVTPRNVYLSDGTYVGFRTTSASGGYTVDINPNDGNQYKVHIAR